MIERPDIGIRSIEIEQRTGSRLDQFPDPVDLLLVTLLEPFCVLVDGTEQRDRMGGVRIGNGKSRMLQRVRKFIRDQLEDSGLDSRIALEEYRIACSTRHDGTKRTISAQEADEIGRQRIGDVAGGRLTSGIAIVNEVVRQQACQQT